MIMLPALRSWVPLVMVLPVCAAWAGSGTAQTLSVPHPKAPAAAMPPPEPAIVRLDPRADSEPPPAAPAPVQPPVVDPLPVAVGASEDASPASASPAAPDRTAPAPEARPAAASSPTPATAAPATPAPSTAAGSASPSPVSAGSPSTSPASAAPASTGPAAATPDPGHADTRAAAPPATAAPTTAPKEQQPAHPTTRPVRPEETLRLQKFKLAALIDRVVIGKEKGQIGHVIDVLVDEKGEPAALVVDVGGFLGVGNRRIAIAWERFALAGRNFRDPLQLPLTDAQVKSAPAYDGNEEVTVIEGTVDAPGTPAANVKGAASTAKLPAAQVAGSGTTAIPAGAAPTAAPAAPGPAAPASSVPAPASPAPAASDVEDPAVSRVDVGHQVEISAGAAHQPEPAAPLHPVPGAFTPERPADAPHAGSKSRPEPSSQPAQQQSH